MDGYSCTFTCNTVTLVAIITFTDQYCIGTIDTFSIRATLLITPWWFYSIYKNKIGSNNNQFVRMFEQMQGTEPVSCVRFRGYLLH